MMLYGSEARGSAQPDSDVDILQVVRSGAGSYRNGRVAVTAYTPAHLHQMAAQGSLFILHLIVDGVVVDDQYGVIAAALGGYVPPASYDPLRLALREAAAALLVDGVELADHLEPIGRLGIYLLRTELYARGASAGSPLFDAELAAGQRDPELLRILRMRRQPRLAEADVQAILAKLVRFFEVSPRGERLADAAVSLAISSPHASGLIAQAISRDLIMDYNAFPLPPL